jgi:hypothetical protein
MDAEAKSEQKHEKSRSHDAGSSRDQETEWPDGVFTEEIAPGVEAGSQEMQRHHGDKGKECPCDNTGTTETR